MCHSVGPSTHFKVTYKGRQEVSVRNWANCLAKTLGDLSLPFMTSERVFSRMYFFFSAYFSSKLQQADIKDAPFHHFSAIQNLNTEFCCCFSSFSKVNCALSEIFRKTSLWVVCFSKPSREVITAMLSGSHALLVLSPQRDTQQTLSLACCLFSSSPI